MTREGQLGRRLKLRVPSLRVAKVVLIRAFAAAMLAAFALQCFVTQTHFHIPTLSNASSSLQGTADQASQPKSQQLLASSKKTGSPFDDPDKCPLCQEYLYAGNYVPPSLIVLHVPSASVSAVVPVVRAIPRGWAVSYNWHGRAPPDS